MIPFKHIFIFVSIVFIGSLCSASDTQYTLKLTVTSDLPMANVPMDPLIDFEKLIKENNLPGVLDHNSIELIDLTDGKSIDFALSPSLTSSQKGRLEWVIENPTHKQYEIRFNTCESLQFPKPKPYVPMIGVGDFLRYNAGCPRPLALPSNYFYADITGDGKKDLFGQWTQPRYPHGLADPLPGEQPVVYPRLDPADQLLFGEPVVWQQELAFDPAEGRKQQDDLDLDGDGLLDRVTIQRRLVEVDGKQRYAAGGELFEYPIVWQKNLGGDPVQYASEQPLPAFKGMCFKNILAVNDDDMKGLFLHLDSGRGIVFYKHILDAPGRFHFEYAGTAKSLSAFVNMGQQAVPDICDWDGDGDWDLLIGDYLGWVRVLINEGTNTHPALAEAKTISADSEPIRIWMSQVYPNCQNHWHNLGYAYPSYIDWDGDGRFDIMLPNESNRIFWYRNIGTRSQPRFSRRQQLNPVGYEDSPEKRIATGKRVMAGLEATPDKGQPFWWRIGADFADFNGDGLMDMITHDGEFRKLTLFTQFKTADGTLKLKMDRRLKLTDGREIDDAVIARKKHWGEHFKAIDWNNDGLTDILYSVAGAHGPVQDHASMFLFINAGTKTDPVFNPPQTIRCFGDPIMTTKHGPRAAVGDLNGDQKPDILATCENPLFLYFSYPALTMPERPMFTLSSIITQ